MSAPLQGVSQGSASDPVLFCIYLNNLFYFLSFDVCNFADDTTAYICEKNLELVLTKLESHSDIAIKWFEDNYMKTKTDKCHLFISGHKFEYLWAEIDNDKIWEKATVKLLGRTIDNELKVDEHLQNVCLNVNRKLSALMRIS